MILFLQESVIKILDALYRDRHYARFFVLETIARVPYFGELSSFFIMHLHFKVDSDSYCSLLNNVCTFWQVIGLIIFFAWLLIRTYHSCLCWIDLLIFIGSIYICSAHVWKFWLVEKSRLSESAFCWELEWVASSTYHGGIISPFSFLEKLNLVAYFLCLCVSCFCLWKHWLIVW